METVSCHRGVARELVPQIERDPEASLYSHPFFQVICIPDGPNRRSIQLECQKACTNAEFRMYVDENADATCDPQRRDEMGLVSLSDVQVDGRAVPNTDVVRKNGQIVGVLLGDLAANGSVRIDAGYELPDTVIGPPWVGTCPYA